MRELQRRQKIRRRLYSMPALVALVVLMAFFARGTLEAMNKRSESARYVRLLETETALMKEKQESLAVGLESLSTPEGIEKEVKEKFNVSREGERVVILVDSPDTPSTEEASKKPWYKRLWSAIISQNQ